MAMNFKNRPKLPHKHEGRIGPYSKDGGRRAVERTSRAPKEDGRADQVAKFQRRFQPTLGEIESDKLTKLSNEYWAPHTERTHKPYDPAVIEDIYNSELNHRDSQRRIMLLEYSQYLENYLWPNFKAESCTKAHLMSIVMVVNEKFRERVPPWFAFIKFPAHFEGFFHKLMELSLMEQNNSDKENTGHELAAVSLREQTSVLQFLNHCFTSMEVDLIRGQIQKLVSLSMWVSLLDRRREDELRQIPRWRKFWKAIMKKDAKVTDEAVKETASKERWFLRNMINKYYSVLDTIQEAEADPDAVSFCEHFLLLVIDLEALLPTRRFFNLVMDDSKLVVKSSMSCLSQRPEGKLFGQLLDQVKFYARFEISDETGDPLDDKQMMAIHYDRITSLQQATFAKYPQMRKFSLATVASIDDRDNLGRHFGDLDKSVLYDIAEYLYLVPEKKNVNLEEYSREFLLELLVSRHEKRDSQLQELNEMPLYPTEEVIWDENVVPGEFYNGQDLLALPKLNLQFLTLHDYLLRNFKLFQLESTYEIRGDIEDVVTRLKPWTATDGQIIFGGWARMALPIQSFSIVQVAKPNIGEKQPSRVRADVSVNLNVKDAVKAEWEGLRRHDVCFLVTVRPPVSATSLTYDYTEDFINQSGLVYVRGCEVEGMLDENGRVIDDNPMLEDKPKLVGDNRTFRVSLDCNQYHMDMETATSGGDDVYETFNILMRRKPKENNFKAVLETIRELMNTQCVVPEFIHDILLGYGDPGAAHYAKMNPSQEVTLNFNDTFLTFDHLRHSFPQHDVKVEEEFADPKMLVPPFRVKFNPLLDPPEDARPSINVEPFQAPNRGPYKYLAPKKNAVPFTPTQIEAIRSGVNHGLTMVVGPPGTGKTDVAVQIISNLYHNYPEQRTLIVTHSNQALNQLFEKIMALDVDERHLLRLGHGEEALETEKDFSRYGRVNYVLGKRMELLAQVDKLQNSLKIKDGALAYTCETAGYFFLYHIQSRWEQYLAKVAPEKAGSGVAPCPVPIDDIDKHFPFHHFFLDAPQPIFKGKSFDEDMEIATGCWRYISNIFTQLEEFRAFELLRNGVDRTKYLVTKEAKIIAMTCTHAALKRKDLVDMGFKYDNILMEESAQILEIETFIPLLLQNPQDGYNRLKRWIMIGDHHQLPPVIKNMAFQKFSNMEQSLFTRLVRLGVPTVDLDAQGRARPSISSLYNWRYRVLGNLPHVLNTDVYVTANGGFSYDYQLVNVKDFNGVGESQPSPFFYQNLAEAEFMVATFMYMRLLGYPSEKISMLTTYNGQKHLLRDVVEARCANNPLIGRPHKITTVDKFQGQQNDYILLSLVKTKNVGHLRDVRRLVVAMSRARLGLYVFGRINLFRNCFELQPAFNLLCKRPNELHLCPNEVYMTKRQANVQAPNPLVVSDMTQMAKFVYDFYANKVAAMAEMSSSRLDNPEVGTIKTTTKPEGKQAGQHPSDDRDSDDEMMKDEDAKETQKEDKKEFPKIVNEIAS